MIGQLWSFARRTGVAAVVCAAAIALANCASQTASSSNPNPPLPPPGPVGVTPSEKVVSADANVLAVEGGNDFGLTFSDTTAPIDVLNVHQSFAPGGFSGWHTHAGPGVVIVQQGTITVEKPQGCFNDFPQGSVLIEGGPAHVHNVINRTGSTVILDAWFFLPAFNPAGGNSRVPESPEVGACKHNAAKSAVSASQRAAVLAAEREPETAASGVTTTGTAVVSSDANILAVPGGNKLALTFDDAKAPIDILQVHKTFAPGGFSGWHTHAGPGVFVVEQGTLTIEKPQGCFVDYPQGSVVFEGGPTKIHNALNRTATPVTIDTIFFLPKFNPAGGNSRIDEPPLTGACAP
jgi:quercetin dioxygenase-like cupin family protein